MEFWFIHSRSHILEVLEAAILWDKIWIEWFEQYATGNLRSDQIAQPGCTTSGCASHKDTLAQVRIGIDIKANKSFQSIA